jgi:hypothetical protein
MQNFCFCIMDNGTLFRLNGRNGVPASCRTTELSSVIWTVPETEFRLPYFTFVSKTVELSVA